MPQAGSSELVLTPGAAVHLLDRIQPPVGEPRDHGCVCLQLPAVKDKVASRLKSLVRSWSSLRLTGPRSSRDKEPNAASLMKQQSLAGPLPIGRQITLRMTAPALTAVNKLPSLARQMSGGRPFLPHRLTSMGRLTNAPASFRRKTLNASRASQPPSGAAGVLKSTRNRHAFSDKVFGRLLENDRLIKEAATKQIARRSSRNTWERRGSHVVAEIMNLLPGVTISPHKRLSEDVQRGSDDSGTNTLHLSSRFQSSMTTNLGLVSMSYFGEESYASQQKKYAFSFGLSSLMRFIPSFVSQRCLDNAVLGYMAEVRKVSVLFLVADLQVFPA